MFRKLLFFFLTLSSLHAYEKEELKALVEDWLEKGKEIQKQAKPCVNCKSNSAPIQTDYPVYLLSSFSMPESSWRAYATELDALGGAFVLRGLPEDSFKSFAKKVQALRNQGINTPIQIYPQLFEECAVEQVPAILKIKEGSYQLLRGHVTIRYALELFEGGGHA